MSSVQGRPVRVSEQAGAKPPCRLNVLEIWKRWRRRPALSASRRGGRFRLCFQTNEEHCTFKRGGAERGSEGSEKANSLWRTGV